MSGILFYLLILYKREVICVESSLFVPIGEQEHLKEFFEVMRDKGKKVQAEDMERLFDYISVLQRDLKDAIEEVDYLRDQIEEMQDQTLKAKFENIQWAVHDSMHNAWDQIKGIKEEFTAQIQNAAAVCKRKGVQALDHALDMTHIQEGLSRLEILLSKSEESMSRRQEKVERAAGELHEVQGHLKNVVNIVRGRETESIGEMDRSKGILAKIERSMEFCKNLISGMKQNLLRARAHLVHFQLSVRQNEEERVPSTQEIMHELSAFANIEFAKQKRTQEVRA